MIDFLEGVIQHLKEADENEEIPYTVGEKDRVYGLEHSTKEELYKTAKEKGVSNRSQMSREDLLEAVKNKLDEGHEDMQMKEQEEKALEASQKLRNKSRDELYRMAQKNRIKGRSEMKKEELLRELRKV